MSIISCSLTTIALRLLLASCLPSSSDNSDPNEKTPPDGSPSTGGPSTIDFITGVLANILILSVFILIIYFIYRAFKAFCRYICGKEDKKWNSELAASVIFVHRNLFNPTKVSGGLERLMKELENEKGEIHPDIVSILKNIYKVIKQNCYISDEFKENFKKLLESKNIYPE